MRAKPTQYGAIRTRSRLEAQWCVYLDAYGESWEYEPTCPIPGYLPDFLIHPSQGYPGHWLEIKPEAWRDRRDADRVIDMARWQVLADTTDLEVVVLFGSPGTWTGGVLTSDIVYGLCFLPRLPGRYGYEWHLSTGPTQAVRDHDYASGERWSAA